MRLLVIAMLAAIVCGCATKPLVIADASPYASQGSVYKGQATVYVARGMGRAGVAWPVHVKLDGVEEGSLQRGTYVRLAVAPGRHDILAHWNPLSTIHEAAINSAFQADETYYFVIDTSMFSSYGAGVINIGGIGIEESSTGAQRVALYEDWTPNARTGN
ncbi:DUF2846 domain-containing protein [Rhodanobacter spathiphylli]|uniref:DUF2846 domain-containing protein n=1 Tax=Rhodanobacter spathiphylli B39 TaxID=1163407 RepID=I4VVM8_9GAMM|nr:DUF2846 domain-containing protein [Rhodanobacter spathiphylli]EIL91269.1 hypothetical protein UU7_13703 [Rhodanobacter spathiphylli B39]